MKKVLAMILAMLMLLAVFAGCAAKTETPAQTAEETKSDDSVKESEAAQTETAAEPVSLVIQHCVSDSNPWQKGALAMESELEATGMFNVDVYANGALCQNDWNVLFDQTMTGSCDIAIESATSLSSLVPEMFCCNLPFMFENQDHLDTWLNSGSELLASWEQKFESMNLKVLVVVSKPFRQMINNKRVIHTPEDVKGLTMRIPDSAAYYTVWEAMGAKPVALAGSEMYSAIQLGTIDGQENSIGNVYDFKTYEVAQYFTIWNYMGDASIVVCNLDKWNAMTQEQQDALLAAASTFATVDKDADVSYQEEAYNAMVDYGTTFYEMTAEEKTAFSDLMGFVYEGFKSTIGEENWNTFVAEVDACR